MPINGDAKDRGRGLPASPRTRVGVTYLLQVLHELEHRLIGFLGVVWDDMGGKGVGLGSVRGGDA